MGSPSDSPLDSVSPRFKGGTLRSAASRLRSALVHLAAASVAGATEKRRPICTVALLSVLRSRRCFSEKSGLGFVKKSKASLTFVMEPLRVRRRSASFETLDSPCGALGSYTVAGRRGTSSARVGKREYPRVFRSCTGEDSLTSVMSGGSGHFVGSMGLCGLAELGVRTRSGR